MIQSIILSTIFTVGLVNSAYAAVLTGPICGKQNDDGAQIELLGEDFRAIYDYDTQFSMAAKVALSKPPIKIAFSSTDLDSLDTVCWEGHAVQNGYDIRFDYIEAAYLKEPVPQQVNSMSQAPYTPVAQLTPIGQNHQPQLDPCLYQVEQRGCNLLAGIYNCRWIPERPGTCSSPAGSQLPLDPCKYQVNQNGCHALTGIYSCQWNPKTPGRCTSN